MQIIFHIGMGKTGTSSIQQALRASEAKLAEQKAVYIGMWFGMIDAEFGDFAGMPKFFGSTPEAMEDYGRRLFDILTEQSQQTGAQVFILSNEALFQNAKKLAPLISTLKTLADVRLIAYVRAPQSWLPSAFLQWGLRHKTQEGPIGSFNEYARSLIGQYDDIRDWQETFGDILTVRLHEKKSNVAQDFAQTIGVDLANSDKRYLERGENAEYVLRALFNNRYKEPVLPEHFNGVVMTSKRFPPPTTEETVESYLDFSGVDDIIVENHETFEYIRDKFGFDFLAAPSEPMPPVDLEDLRHRLMDYMMEIMLDQSARIRRLERRIGDLEGKPS